MLVKHQRCESCEHKILDEFIYWVAGTPWHKNCLKCNICKCQLSEKCYRVSDELYCPDHYHRYFGINCALCTESIKPGSMVQFFNGSPVHHSCFKCYYCSRVLVKGEQYFVNCNRIFCKSEWDSLQSSILSKT
ncbi:hypothetical protein GJ496_005278, partial [Pomphorhynchus laevis]